MIYLIGFVFVWGAAVYLIRRYNKRASMTVLLGGGFLGACGTLVVLQLASMLLKLDRQATIDVAEEKTPATVDVAPPYQPPEPKFVFNDGLDYGYSAELGQEDKLNGIKAKPLLVFRYLGHKGDAYQVVLVDGDVRNVFEAKPPFEYAAVHTFYKNRYESKSIMPLADGTVAAAVISDAVMGYMKQYTGKQQGKPVQFWVDGEAKKLIVSAADAL